MSENAPAGEDHRDPVFVRRLDHLVIANRAARLDNRFYARSSRSIDAVTEWEERIRGQNRTIQVETLVLRLQHGDARRIHAARLPCPDAERTLATSQHDRVGLYGRTNAPG